MRAIASTLLLLATTSGWAGVVKVTAASGTAYYVGPVAAGAMGRVRSMSVIHDYSKPEPGGVRSRRAPERRAATPGPAARRGRAAAVARGSLRPTA